nr:unnamed protein product [Digitaria exilis]
MPDAEEVEAARRVATHALAELWRHDISCPTSPPGADLPALLRRCLQLLPLLNAGDPSLATRFYRRLHGSLGAILSRDPSPALLPLLEVLAECLCFSERFRSCLAMADYESDIDRLIEDNQHILHDKIKQKSTLDMKNILSDILCCAKQKEVLESDTEVSDGIVCLAAVLRVPARTKAIALQYETIHKIHKRRHIDGDGSSLSIYQSKSRKANGQAFLECHPQYSPEWNDIIDFVECEEGKDYTNTLKQQSKFRMFKYKKWDIKRQSIMESTKDALGLNSRRLFG